MGKSKARDTLNERRCATSKSTMKFAACSMCKPLNNRCFEVLAEVPRHVMDRFYKEMKMYKRGPQGCLDLHQELCRGGYVPTIEKLLSHCSEQKFASLLQFKLGRTSPALLKQDRIVAKASWRMVVALAGGLARFSLLYSHFPPYCALALTDECSVTVEKKLAWMKRCWQTFDNLEKEARVSKDAQEELRGAVFPPQVFCRETFLQLLVVDFKSVPEMLREDLRDWGSGLMSSLANELNNNHWRTVQRHDKGNSFLQLLLGTGACFLAH